MSCRVTINRRMLETTKKRYPMSKDKKRQQGSRRGTIMTKSNFMPTGWVTHRLENNTKEVLALLWRFGTPRQASPVWGTDKGTGDPQGIWPKPSRIWSQDLHRNGGNRDLEGTNKTLHAPRFRGKEQWLHRNRKLNQNYMLVLEGPLWRPGSAGAHHRHGGTGSSCLGKSPLA